MPKKAKELSALAVQRLKEDGRYFVGGADGLHLRVAGGSRAWVVRLMVAKKRCDIGLGPYPELSLSEAREAAIEQRKKVRNGIDPLAERRASRDATKAAKLKTKTFKECGEAFISENEADWTNPKHRQQWKNTLATYAYPAIGAKSVGIVNADDVEAILKPIWRSKAETAKRLRMRMEKVFDYAKSKGYREGDNPAALKGNMRERLGKAKREVKHHAALPYGELGTFMAELRKREGTSARALEFAILCASRSGEVRDATWDEFDLDAHRWTIPRHRMKADREHVVPLSDAAVALLKAEAAKPRLEGVKHVFPAPRGGALSDMALTAVLKRMERTGLTQHGFRSTFRDWAGETTSYPREVIEHALAHQLADKAEAAYQRGSLLPKRVLLMADWAKFCALEPSAGNVVTLAKDAA